MAQQCIGILLNANIARALNTGNTKFENIAYYENAAKSFGLIPCFFSLKAIDMHTQTVAAYLKEEQSETYVKKQIAIPRIIHNRAMLLRKQSHRMIDRLIQQGCIVFNHRTRYSKLKIHKLLNHHNEIKRHLPVTARATERSIRTFMKRHHSLILKPNSGSVGLGILKLEKRGRRWMLTYPKTKYGDRMGKIIVRKRLPAWLLKRIRKRSYIVQETIPLATFDGQPFDLRVSVQRNMFGEWQVTGIVGKVAAKSKFVTNIAQGGKVLSLPELLSKHPTLHVETVTTDLIKLSTEIAEELSRHLPHLADLGLDIGIDEAGTPYFIECNCRDLRISFKKGKMLETWESAFENPIGYASFLSKQLHKKQTK